MKTKTVKELMVPLSEYATVSQDSTLLEAVATLEQAQKEFDDSRYRHRAILVFDQNQKIVGKVSQMDLLRALEPKYDQMFEKGKLARFGFNRDFLKNMLDQFQLWNEPLRDICRKAAQTKIKNFMYTPTEGEYVEAEASLNVAIHQLVMGHHQSLLVTDKNDIVGILRLTDVFMAVTQAIKECET